MRKFHLALNISDIKQNTVEVQLKITAMYSVKTNYLGKNFLRIYIKRILHSNQHKYAHQMMLSAKYFFSSSFL